jgi:hypothetical protein
VSSRALVALGALALAWRLTLAQLTPVPSEDGVNYLWMAEQFAAGEWRAPLGEVFPPLLSLLIAGPLWLAQSVQLEVSTFALAQVVLALCGAATVWPVAALCALWQQGDANRARRAALVGALFVALPALAARYCAEVYTEPLFGLCVAHAALALARGRAVAAGLACALAFWLRSEALLLPLAALACAPRRAWRTAAIAGGAVAALAAWRSAAGHGFALLPKLAFNWDKAAVGGDTLRALARGLTALPGAWLEAFLLPGLLALPMLWRHRERPAARALLLTLAGALVVVLGFAVRRRFLVAWWPLLAPFAVEALLALPARVRHAALVLSLGLGVAVGLRTTDASRLAERDVGRWLATQLRADEEFVTDLTRVRYFAGRRPLPPRHASADELTAACTDPRVRFLILGSNREHAATVRSRCPEFSLAELPAELPAACAGRGIAVLRR